MRTKVWLIRIVAGVATAGGVTKISNSSSRSPCQVDAIFTQLAAIVGLNCTLGAISARQVSAKDKIKRVVNKYARWCLCPMAFGALRKELSNTNRCWIVFTEASRSKPVISCLLWGNKPGSCIFLGRKAYQRHSFQQWVLYWRAPLSMHQWTVVGIVETLHSLPWLWMNRWNNACSQKGCLDAVVWDS